MTTANPNEGPTGTTPIQDEGGPGIAPEKVDEILNFDPFGPPEEGEKKGEEAPKEGAPQGEGADPAKGPAGEEPPKDPAPAPAPAAPDPLAALQRTIEQQQQQIATLLSKMPEAKPAEQPKAEEVKPAYNFQAPPALVQALNHEDEATRTQALSLLINSVMNRIHLDVTKAIEERIGKLTQELPTQVQHLAQQTTQVQRIEQDILGAYPVLADNSQLRQLFFNTMAQIAQARQNAGLSVQYSAELRDAAAAQLSATLSIPITNLQGKAQPGPQGGGAPQPAGRTPARAPFAGGSSAARGGNGAANTAFGADLLGDF